MPVDELREAVHGLMGRAKDDLSELVAFQSVADPKQYPPEECAKAARSAASASGADSPASLWLLATALSIIAIAATATAAPT